MNLVALSGGYDSTAMALRLAEVEPSDYAYILTPTGDELPEMEAHWGRLENALDAPLVRLHGPEGRGLNGWIDHFNALPNYRMRWCTRLLKIQPFMSFLAAQEGDIDEMTAFVGLRADEEGRAGGVYIAKQRFPLREWGWNRASVEAYVKHRGLVVPKRTDCARCFFQRLIEWWALWREHPDIFAHAEAQEERIGHTFRSPSRDTWPAALKGLRERFEQGDKPVDRGPRGSGNRCWICAR